MLCGPDVAGGCRKASPRDMISVGQPGLNSLPVAVLALIKRTQKHSQDSVAKFEVKGTKVP